MCGEGPAVRGSNPIWSLVDLQGLQFDDTYYLWVLENDIPYIPAVVWHDAAMTLPWTSPIQFLANGTLPIDIYFDPSKFYRLEFRHNLGLAPPSQADPLIYLVPNYSPGNNAMTPIGGEGITTENQISNPQFAIMNSSEPYTFTGANPDPIEVAPGWTLELAGNGTVTVERIALNTTVPTPTNAPYALRIQLAGAWVGEQVLRQRFSQNGQNWQDKNVSTSLTARVTGAPAQISVRLDASNNQPIALLLTDTLSNLFEQYSGTALVGNFANLDIPPDAFIDYKVILPTVGDFYFTSFQLIVSDTDNEFQYEQITIDRQIDHLFHYYKPQLEAKPIPSYLVGWDFPLNPAQINGDAVAAFAGVNSGQYAWDQLITFQTVSNDVTVDRALDGAVGLVSAVGGGQVAILQYLDSIEARKLLSGRMAVNLNGLTTAIAGLSGTVTLWVTDDATLPDLTLGDTPITALDAVGRPTMGNGTWTEVPNVFQNTAFTLGTTDGETSLNGWTYSGGLQDTANYFVIVVGFAPWVLNDVIIFNSISLCAGDIATRPAPKTIDQTLRDCERYYETSYTPVAGVVSAVSAINQLTAPMTSEMPHATIGITAAVIFNSFGFEYRTKKRTPSASPPDVFIFSPITGTADRARLSIIGTPSGSLDVIVSANWAAPTVGDKAVSFNTNGVAFGGQVTTLGANHPLITWINYQYVVDARLGILL